MTEDLSKSPVAVRLAYRYPNGSMVSYSARAIARKGDSINVVVNEYFDEGITLAVHAPFLEGLCNFRVIEVSRSIRKPGYFETLLRPADAVSAGKGDGQAPRESRASDEDLAAVGEATVPMPEAVAAAAAALADRLDIEPPLRFSEALRGVAVELRPAALVVTAAAVLHLLDLRGAVRASSLLVGAEPTTKIPAAKHFPKEAIRKAG